MKHGPRECLVRVLTSVDENWQGNKRIWTRMLVSYSFLYCVVKGSFYVGDYSEWWSFD